MLISLLLLAATLGSTKLQARGWLPDVPNPKVNVRLLQCHYDKAQLVESKPVTSTSDNWTVNTTTEQIRRGGLQGQLDCYTFVVRRSQKDAGVAVAFDRYDWSSDNYVMLPASVYNGNRQRIVNRKYGTCLDKTDFYFPELALTSNPIPQLSPEFGAPSRLEVNASNVATPCFVCFDRKKGEGIILLTDQGFMHKGQMMDHAFIVEETPDRSLASFVIGAPGVRSRKPEFISFSQSPDRGISVETGDTITIRVSTYRFPARNVDEVIEKFFRVRKLHVASADVRDLMPMSEVLKRMTVNIDKRYFKNKDFEYYCPENATWMSFGWIGGLINTYPMMALGDEEHLRRVANTFNFCIPRGQAQETGFFYTYIDDKGKIFDRSEGLIPVECVLTRQNADVLYWTVKHLLFARDLQWRPDSFAVWETHIRKLADAFATLWEHEGTWGNYINIRKGNIAVYNTMGGAIAVGGLAWASRYFNEPRYMKVAREAAKAYVDRYNIIGFTSGGCGDILQNSDSETAIALTTSLMALYETTGEEQYLQQARSLAHLTSSWVASFNYYLPSETPLAKLGAKLTGAVWASTQNKHGAPGFCTSSGDPYFKIYRATGDTLYAELMKDVLHAHAEGIQPNGQITERLTYCDAELRGSRLDGGKTGWNETNGALMALEIPGIYLRTDADDLYVFDHVKVTGITRSESAIVLQIYNPTAFDASVSILAESAEKARQPLGLNAFINWPKVDVKAGKTVKYKIKLN